MASHDVKNIKECALVVANDLRTGLTVYLSQSEQWSDTIAQAWRLYDDETAQIAMQLARESELANQVIAPYLVDASKTGGPSHIREKIRVDGPTILYGPSPNLAATGTGA